MSSDHKKPSIPSVHAQVLPAAFVLLWSTGFIGARYAMPWAEPFTFLVIRFVLALAVLFLVFCFVKPVWQGWPVAVHATIAGGLMQGVYLGGVFWAIHKGLPAGIAALIAGLQPLLTAPIAGRFLGDRILPRHWFGLVLGFVGVIVVLFPKFGVSGAGITPLTVGAAFIAVIGISAGTIWQKTFVQNADLLTGTAWQYVGGTAVVLPLSFLFETQVVQWNGEIVFAIAWLVLVLSIGTVFLLLYLIRSGEVSKVASLFYLVPTVTAVIAFMLFREPLSLVQIGGMVITMVAVAIATS